MIVIASILIIIIILIAIIGVIASVRYFYRDPERQPLQIKDAFLSPADGTIVAVRRYMAGETPSIKKGSRHISVAELAGTEMLGSDGTIISIHISPLDVHTIRAPADGKVIHISKISGGLKFMRDPSFEVENERVCIVFETLVGEIGVIIVGAPIASSVNVLVDVGERVDAGERIARIKLGSLASLIIPDKSRQRTAIRCGVKVKAGLSIITQKRDVHDKPIEECYRAIHSTTIERVYLIFLVAFIAMKRLYSLLIRT